MTGVAVLVRRGLRATNRGDVGESVVVWTAILVVDVPFVLERLVRYPVLTPGIIAGVFGSAAVFGTVFGWFYWKRIGGGDGRPPPE